MPGNIIRAAVVGVAGLGMVVGGVLLWEAWTSMQIAAKAPELATRGPAAVSRVVPGALGPLVSFDEFLSNVNASNGGGKVHSLSLRIELELFAEEGRDVVEQKQSGIKNAVIETIHEQYFSQLNSLPGRLYFKEQLVSRINTFLNEPVVRDIHFSSFYLR